MSRVLSDILHAQEPYFSHALKDLESKTGHNGHDVRLVSDLAVVKKNTALALGLDASDTTIQELYYALRHRGMKINDVLEAQLAITSRTTPEELVQRVVSFIDTMAVNREVWTVKHAVIKQAIKDAPPKKVMKALGLRSIDSVLKRTSAYELLTLGYQLESDEWRQKIQAKLKKLRPSDLGAAQSQLFHIAHSKTNKLHKAGYKKHTVVIPNYETGSIVVLTPEKRFVADTLAITLAILQSLYDLRVYSAYFRFISVKPEFGKKFQSAIKDGLPNKVHGQHIGWRAVQKYFNNHPEHFHMVEQPQLQYEDIALQYPADTLRSHLIQDVEWPGVEYGVVHQADHPISTNLIDVVTSTNNNFAHDSGMYSHAQRALTDELAQRYLNHDEIIGLVITILDEPA